MQNKDILLRNGLLIDGTGNNVKQVNIGIKNGKIDFIEESISNDITEEEYDAIIDIDELFVLPGFINAHAHTGFKQLDGKNCRGFHKEYLKACINEGVTTIRDEGMFLDSTIESVVSCKKDLEKTNSFPKLVTTGKFFSAPGGYGGMEPIEVSTIEDAKYQVDKVIDTGIDMIKTVLEDGLDPSTFGLPKLSDELLEAICEKAHNRGVKVSAHVTQAHNLEKLVKAGIDDAGHMVYDELSDELIQEMIDKDICIVPTLTVLKMISDKYGAPLLEQGKRNVKKFVQMGGKIGFGDDFIEQDDPWYRLGMPRMELLLLKEAGLTNMQIIVAATKNSALICAMQDKIGTVELGKNADLLIVKGNPLDNIENINNVQMVLKDGYIVVDNIL